MIFNTEQPLTDMVEVIVRETNPKKIILFGSRARGTAGPNSDLDLMIVEEGPFGPNRSRRKELTKLWKILCRFPISQDILIYTPEEIKRWQHSKNHVIARAMREGKVLYERS